MNSEIKLDKPVVFFDIESTGTNIQKDRIVEISVIKVFPDGRQQSNTRRVNPEMHIPEAASAIHGIYDADVADAPTFRDIAQNLKNYIADSDLGGYNIVKFDIPMLEAEFARAGVEYSANNCRIIDVFNIFCRLYPRTLSAAYEFFCGKKLEDAHSAAADTQATLDVFLGQLAKHPEIPRSMDELNEFCDNSDPDAVDRNRRFKWVGDDVVINFGKNNGAKLKDIAVEDPNFLRWILRSDFPNDVKKIASDALIGVFPVRKKAPDA